MGDLLLLAMSAAAVATLGRRCGRDIWLLVAAWVLVSGADTVFALRAIAGTYVEGAPLDIAWPLSSLVIASAATRVSAGRTDAAGADQDSSWWSALLVPATFTLASLVLLVLSDGADLGRYPAAGTVAFAAVRAALTFREVSALSEARSQARTDELTGLCNRRGFVADLDAALASEHEVAVLLLDLDQFKEVNDALGHLMGDRLLRMVGDRLATCIGRRDVLARLGGDEFAMLVSADSVGPDRAGGSPAGMDAGPGTTGAAAGRLAQRICDVLREPFVLPEISLHVGASMGVAWGAASLPASASPLQAPSARTTVSQGGSAASTTHATSARLLQEADVAMYEAKARGGGLRFYDPSTDACTRDRLETIEQLRAALEADELVLHYQPQVDLRTRSLMGVEALVRWQHPRRGLLAPVDFVPLAEQAGLMQPLTDWVLDASLAQVATWRGDGRRLRVSVNMSASNLLDAAFTERAARLLDRHQVPGDLLQIEITENTMMTDPRRAQQVVARFEEPGVSVSIDDYGTGYSSLAHLRDLQVSELKLDRTFVRHLSERRSEAIVKSTIDLAHSLGLVMVAEGVEDEASARTLAALGCDTGQGFYYARPMPVEQLQSWLDDDHHVVTSPAERAPRGRAVASRSTTPGPPARATATATPWSS